MNELERIPTERKRISQYIIGNARTLIMVLILFVVIVVMTTDIKLVTISSITDLGLEFFVVLFCSYGMYVCCADGGITKGLTTDIYTESIKRFDELKQRIEESMLSRMNDFCIYYVEEELRKTRMQYLSIACIPYSVYLEKYVMLGKKELKALPDLTETQRKAIRRANKVRRIKLTPEMIMTSGKMVHGRAALSITPGTMKYITFSAKMVKMCVMSFCVSLIALEVILEPSWTVFAEVCLKLVTVVLNGFDGRKEGYNNITIHTVNFTNMQSSLMVQAIQFAERTPAET